MNRRSLNRRNALMSKLVNKWNKDFPRIIRYIHNSPRDSNSRIFYWSQMVWQECRMYVTLGKPVSKKEFKLLCVIRDFNKTESNYIRSMINYLRLGWTR